MDCMTGQIVIFGDVEIHNPVSKFLMKIYFLHTVNSLGFFSSFNRVLSCFTLCFASNGVLQQLIFPHI
jgi:hypothetical protein